MTNAELSAAMDKIIKRLSIENKIARMKNRCPLFALDVRHRDDPKYPQWVMEADQIDAMNSIGFTTP